MWSSHDLNVGSTKGIWLWYCHEIVNWEQGSGPCRALSIAHLMLALDSKLSCSFRSSSRNRELKIPLSPRPSTLHKYTHVCDATTMYCSVIAVNSGFTYEMHLDEISDDDILWITLTRVLLINVPIESQRISKKLSAIVLLLTSTQLSPAVHMAIRLLIYLACFWRDSWFQNITQSSSLPSLVNA